ncbi:MAG TPA: hypothetical protein VFG69_12025 [Nannocystaceae bacterium]|nr:hypothetical protein [Nannocystaceae bacterium]
MSGPSEPTSLAPRDEERVDAYERKYMAGQGMVLYRGKRPAPKWLQLATGSMAIVGLVMLFTPSWITGLVFVPLGIILWALFAVLRFTVSEGAVTVQYGLFGPTIPTAAIESAEAIDYDWKKFGGWGIRYSIDGEWMYNMPGDHGRAVRIVWRDERGRRCVTNIGTPRPEPAVAAIEQAMHALPAASSRAALARSSDDPSSRE